MKRYRLAMLFTAVTFCALAQQVTVSNPSKLPFKAGKFKIIGKNNDGLIVRLYGSEDIINIYSDELRLIATKTLEFKNQSGLLQYIMLNKTGAVVFYLQQDRKSSTLLAQPVNSKFMDIGKAVVIDSIFDRKDLVSANLRFKASTDQNYLFVYYPFFVGSTVQTMKFMCLDRGLNVVYNKTVPLNRGEQEMEELKSLIDNQGNSYLIFKPETKSGKDQYDVYRISNTGELAIYSVTADRGIFGEAAFDMDDKNGNIILSGFSHDGKEHGGDDYATGFLYQSFNPVTGKTVSSNYTVFPHSFITDLTGREPTGEGKLYTFNIKKVVLRNDGGALIIAESFIKDNHESAVPLAMPGYNTYHTSTIYQYNDIIAFSIKPDGALDWNSIMRKKQVSEDDNGYYSSFSIMNEKDELRFMYLDDVSSTGNLDQYLLKSDGKNERSALFNQDEKDVLLLPKMARQISPDDMIIPSYKNGEFKLVKLSF